MPRRLLLQELMKTFVSRLDESAAEEELCVEVEVDGAGQLSVLQLRVRTREGAMGGVEKRDTELGQGEGVWLFKFLIVSSWMNGRCSVWR